jgi:hypothetical protein
MQESNESMLLHLIFCSEKRKSAEKRDEKRERETCTQSKVVHHPR